MATPMVILAVLLSPLELIEAACVRAVDEVWAAVTVAMMVPLVV
jgi:hypothetical protein